MRTHLIIGTVIHFLILLILTHVTVGGSTEPIIQSRVSSGRSSSISFPDALVIHKLKLSQGNISFLRKDSMTSSLSKNEVKQNIKLFVDTYGLHLGIKYTELRESRTHQDVLAGLAYHHFDQVISGYTVYAGDVVVTVSMVMGGKVVESSGHAMSASLVEDRAESEKGQEQRQGQGQGHAMWGQDYKDALFLPVSDYIPPLMSWLNEDAPWNMEPISVTLDTSHPLISWLNRDAPQNIEFASVTFDTSHRLMSWLNDDASANM